MISDETVKKIIMKIVVARNIALEFKAFKVFRKRLTIKSVIKCQCTLVS